MFEAIADQGPAGVLAAMTEQLAKLPAQPLAHRERRLRSSPPSTPWPCRSTAARVGLVAEAQSRGVVTASSSSGPADWLMAHSFHLEPSDATRTAELARACTQPANQVLAAAVAGGSAPATTKPRSCSPSTTTPSKTPSKAPDTPWTAPSSHPKPSASSPATPPSSPWSWAARANPWTSDEPNAWSPQPCWPRYGPETKPAPSPAADAHPNGPTPTTSNTGSTADPPPSSTSRCSAPTTSPRSAGGPHMGTWARPHRKSHRLRRHLDDLTDDDPRRRQESPLSKATPKYPRGLMIQLTLGSFTCLVTVVTRQRGDALPKELRAPRSCGSRRWRRTAPGRAGPRDHRAWTPWP